MKRIRIAVLTLAIAIACGTQAGAIDNSGPGNWSALASDRIARNVGDILTVVVYETSTATDSAESTVNKSSSLQGSVSAGTQNSIGFNGSASLGLGHAADNAGTTTRAGTMVGQISATIDQLLPNGDLHVTGVQVIDVNGEKTRISVSGKVRPYDISATNVVLSTSLADASIEYNGAGLVSDSSKPGLLTRALNWIGLP